eukprot:15457505-Alexandrium_andersonii.AAC.1
MLDAFQRVYVAKKRLKLPGAASWLAEAVRKPFWWSVDGGLAPPDTRGSCQEHGLAPRAQQQ